ncbi:MAG TPA: UDP-N-acetylmuramoyl-L-alanyl-D-glutamate--2,6-diaminopimelate ligase [Bdellovibrionota bacterium]|nr:UDP-N-acetylmuramoyl-L-alanyl-D-glutamate--2,6-diaminopimelate ligase [Bdellovibrionota bacterium]
MYEKFPILTLGGMRLIWDLRQDFASVPEAQRRVYVKSHLDAETRAKLGAIPAAEYVTEDQPEVSLAQDAAKALRYPSREVRVIAVTGTNGKSTTVALLGQLFSLESEGEVAVLGTLGLQIFRAGEVRETVEIGYTTPDAPGLQYLLRACRDRGISHLIMEASSQGWSLGRLAGLEIEALGFTNLTQDHLDFHGSMEAYAQAKASIFHHALRGVGVMHASEDPWSARFVADVSAKLGLRGRTVNFQSDFLNLRSELDGHHFDFDGTSYHAKLVGRHNLENLRVAFELFRTQFGRYPAPENVLRLVAARGRLDLCGSCARPYVYVDYAHTPDALEKSLTALATLKRPEQKLWVVFGCGGDRDATKRPLMGGVAARFADAVVVTSDNPRTEDPLRILEAVRSGVTQHLRLAEPDRRRAIEWALSTMSPSDVLLIAGKGHEEYQIIGTEKRDFSDFAVVRDYLNR